MCDISSFSLASKTNIRFDLRDSILSLKIESLLILVVSLFNPVIYQWSDVFWIRLELRKKPVSIMSETNNYKEDGLIYIIN